MRLRKFTVGYMFGCLGMLISISDLSKPAQLIVLFAFCLGGQFLADAICKD